MNSKSLQTSYFVLQAFAAAACMALLLAFSPVADSAAETVSGQSTHVALDAGHGGSDSGASGPTGVMEKDVMLRLAQKLALRLESTRRVTLTRSADYQMPLAQRAAVANAAESDLLISLHTGAFYQHSTKGITIYYHRPLPEGDVKSDHDRGNETESIRWHDIQRRHLNASRKLAEALQNALVDAGTASNCRVASAPLIVLEGADMPAVLLEFGPITNPAAESELASEAGLERLTQAIEIGIAHYYTTTVHN